MAVNSIVIENIARYKKTDIYKDLLRKLAPELFAGEILDNPVFDQADGRIYNYGDTNPFGELPVSIDVVQNIYRNRTGQSPENSNNSLQSHILYNFLQS